MALMHNDINIVNQKNYTIIKRQKLKGFSLIEIMVVITLIGIILGTVSVTVFNSLAESKINIARTQAYELEKALNIYRLRHGFFPSTARGLRALIKPEKGPPIMEYLPLDPWGEAFLYVFPGQKNYTKPDVYSKGPDKEESEDDIGNWPAGK